MIEAAGQAAKSEEPLTTWTPWVSLQWLAGRCGPEEGPGYTWRWDLGNLGRFQVRRVRFEVEAQHAYSRRRVWDFTFFRLYLGGVLFNSAIRPIPPSQYSLLESWGNQGFTLHQTTLPLEELAYAHDWKGISASGAVLQLWTYCPAETLPQLSPFGGWDGLRVGLAGAVL